MFRSYYHLFAFNTKSRSLFLEFSLPLNIVGSLWLALLSTVYYSRLFLYLGHLAVAFDGKLINSHEYA